MFNIENFHLKDPAPNIPLENIFPISSRALALLVRNQNQPILKTGFLNFYGAVDMIDGLQYHHDNFVRTTQILTGIEILSEISKPYEKQLRHEVVAYLNRLGQIFYFARSEFVAKRLYNAKQLIPTISKFIIFREKHAAHRSIDAPRKEDTLHQQQLQAWSLSSISAFVYERKDKSEALENFHKSFLDPKMTWGKNYLGFQMRGKNKDEDDFLNFFIEKEHEKISLEAFNLIEQLIAWQNKS